MELVAQWLDQNEALHESLNTHKITTQNYQNQIHDLENLIKTLDQIQKWEQLEEVFETIENKKHDTMQVINFLSKVVITDQEVQSVLQNKVIVPLKQQLSKDLEHFLENELVEWPTLPLSSVNTNKLQVFHEKYLIPFLSLFEWEQTKTNNQFDYPIELFTILMKPFVYRFQFHFYGKKKSNRLDRPEWFFQFVKKFLEDQYDYFSQLQHQIPIAKNVDYYLLQACVPLVQEKVKELVDVFTTEAQFQKALWSHLLQQTISFIFFIKNKYQIVLDILNLEPFYNNYTMFEWWISHDKSVGLEQMIYKNEHLFINIKNDTNTSLDREDEMKPSPSCIPLLQYVTYLNEHALQFISPSTSHAWQYFDSVVLFLLRYYLHHILQTKSDADDVLVQIYSINTCYYVHHVIQEWTKIDYCIPFSDSIEEIANEYMLCAQQQIKSLLPLLQQSQDWRVVYAPHLSSKLSQIINYQK